MAKYVAPKRASEMAGVSAGTLRNWAKAGKIRHSRTRGGHYRYDADDLVRKGVGMDDSVTMEEMKACIAEEISRARGRVAFLLRGGLPEKAEAARAGAKCLESVLDFLEYVDDGRLLGDPDAFEED